MQAGRMNLPLQPCNNAITARASAHPMSMSRHRSACNQRHQAKGADLKQGPGIVGKLACRELHHHSLQRLMCCPIQLPQELGFTMPPQGGIRGVGPKPSTDLAHNLQKTGYIRRLTLSASRLL